MSPSFSGSNSLVSGEKMNLKLPLRTLLQHGKTAILEIMHRGRRTHTTWDREKNTQMFKVNGKGIGILGTVESNVTDTNLPWRVE